MALSQYPPKVPPTGESLSDLLNPYPTDISPNISYSQAAQSAPPDQVWTQRVLDEIKDLLLLLNAQGRITYASPSSKLITGHTPKQLEGSILNEFIHDDDKPIFLHDIDESVASNEPFHTHVRFRKANGMTTCVLEINGHPHIANEDDSKKRKRASQERCVGFFLMCHVYPTKSSTLLDSFLEHKIANARLVQQIAQLVREEEEEANLVRKSLTIVDAESVDNSAPRSSSDQESTDTLGTNSSDSDTNHSSNTTLERGALPNPPSLADGIEVMTGLQYSRGERSEGLSTGHGRLINCDIDITTAEDHARNAQEGDRRKRLRGRYVCTDCTRTDSPEWRKGPEGPKTLCNACGCK